MIIQLEISDIRKLSISIWTVLKRVLKIVTSIFTTEKFNNPTNMQRYVNLLRYLRLKRIKLQFWIVEGKLYIRSVLLLWQHRLCLKSNPIEETQQISNLPIPRIAPREFWSNITWYRRTLPCQRLWDMQASQRLKLLSRESKRNKPKIQQNVVLKISEYLICEFSRMCICMS